jgi:hypothetical protein
MSNHSYRNRWRLTDRANFLSTVMSIPERMAIPIAYGHAWAHADLPIIVPGLEPFQTGHVWAFFHCVTSADKWIRKNAGPDEIATIEVAGQIRTAR